MRKKLPGGDMAISTNKLGMLGSLLSSGDVRLVNGNFLQINPLLRH